MTSPVAASGAVLLSMVPFVAGCCESRVHVAEVYGRRCYVLTPAAPYEEPCSTGVVPAAPAAPAPLPGDYYPVPGGGNPGAPPPPSEPRAQDRVPLPSGPRARGESDAAPVGFLPGLPRRLLPQVNARIVFEDLYGRVRNRPAARRPSTRVPADAPVASAPPQSPVGSPSQTQLVGYESRQPVSLGAPEFDDAVPPPIPGAGHSVTPRR